MSYGPKAEPSQLTLLHVVIIIIILSFYPVMVIQRKLDDYGTFLLYNK